MKSLIDFETIKNMISKIKLVDILQYQGGISSEFDSQDHNISTLELRISFQNSEVSIKNEEIG